MDRREFERQVDVIKAMIKLRLKKQKKRMPKKQLNEFARKCVQDYYDEHGRFPTEQVTDPDKIKVLNEQMMGKLQRGEIEDFDLNIPGQDL